MTLLASSFAFAGFASHFRGSDSIPAVRTERIEAYVYDLSLEHHFGGGIAAGLRLPIGQVVVEPVGGDSTAVAGFGDLELHGSYDLRRLWTIAGRQGSLRIRPSLLLPSGVFEKTADASSDVPPNVISIGNGSVGGALQLRLGQPLTRSVSTRAWAGVRGPFLHNSAGLRFGMRTELGLGASYRPVSWAFVAMDVIGLHRRRGKSRAVGALVNSGGQWAFADLSLTFFPRRTLAVGIRARAPLYVDVNGEQISQSVGLAAFVAVRFGGDDDDEHGHEHDGHDHAEDSHDHAADESHDGSGDADESLGDGDVQDLALGGESFALSDARVRDKVVAIDFWASWCKPCKKVGAFLDHKAKTNADFAVRKVEVPTFDSAVAKEHLGGAKGLPVVWLMDASGQVVRKLDAVDLQRLEHAVDELLGD